MSASARGVVGCTVVVALAVTLAGVWSSLAAQAQETDLEVVKVRKNFYMIAGAGGNIGVQIGSDGIVLVNAGSAQASDRVLVELKKTAAPVKITPQHLFSAAGGVALSQVNQNDIE